MRLGEHVVRTVAVALVLTGQMLPAGSVSAQDEPASPTLSAPVAPSAAELLAAPTATENAQGAVPAPLPVDEQTEETLPPVASPERTPADVPSSIPAEVPVKAASEAAIEIPPASETLPVGGPEQEVMESALDPNTYRFGDWTMTIRPGVFPPRSEPYIQAPIDESPAPLTNVFVPVTVNIHHTAPQVPYWDTPWSYPWSYSSYRNVPTSAYLFQRPQPRWQIRGDFYHLRPFIPGLMY